MSNNHIEIESLEGVSNKPFIIKMLHNDFRWWHSGVEMFQLSRLADGITTALVSHGDIENGVTYIQGLAKIDRIVDSLTIDEQLTVKGISGHHLNHFVLDLKTNELKIKMNDGVEVLQITDLSEPNTVSLVSHGNTTNGVIDINGILKVKGRQIVGAFESSITGTDDVTTEIDTGIPNTKASAKVYLHVETPSQDSFIEIEVIKQGGSYLAVMGWQTGTEFTQLSVAYNQTKSNQFGTHYIDIFGTGNGAAMTYNVKTESNFK